MDSDEFNHYYDRFTYFAENIDVLVNLRSRNCGNNIYKYHIESVLDELIGDFYAGEEEGGVEVIIVYLLYGVLNYQHYRGLLSLYHILMRDMDGNWDPNLLDDNNTDLNHDNVQIKLTNFFNYLIDLQLEWFREHVYRSNDELTTEEKQRYTFLYNILYKKRQDTHNYVKALVEFLSEAFDLFQQYTRPFNVIQQAPDLEKTIQRSWGRVVSKYYHNMRNNYMTAGELLQNCGDVTN